MKRTFFARQIPFFGNRAMLILCIVFFLLPFLLRGARLGIDSMKNDVADWLPKSFDETTELAWFRDHFVGDQFVLISWDGCTEGDSRFDRLVKKIKAECSDLQPGPSAEMTPSEQSEYDELMRAKLLGDRLGWHTTGNYHEDWSTTNDKWFQGYAGKWYFIQRDGDIYEWDGQMNVIHSISRAAQRFFNGDNVATGKYIDTFGQPNNNKYYRDPSLLFCRMFKNVITGPQIFDEMAGPGGTYRVGEFKEGDLSVFQAELEAHRRLTGVLFGPTPSEDFRWNWRSFLKVIPDDKREMLTEDHQYEFDQYLKKIVDENYDGDWNRLANASQDEKIEHWYSLWRVLKIEPPARQTAILVTLNEPVLDDLAWVVGRPVLGKPRGRLLALASGECGIEPENLHIGGPPVDNVAIDEEGSITLFRLVSLSAVIGISLAYLSFRSIRVTLMLFFVGGVAAMASLSFVYFGGNTLDAILMTMPSLVYVLGISGAVHVVNYYRDACREDGIEGAAETAVRHGWFPCTLAAFTTALGLVSLYTSNLIPIKKFGLFSAIATMATVILLFTYLPSALTVWPPKYGKRSRNEDAEGSSGFNLANAVASFWRSIGEWVIKRHALVTIVSILFLAGFGYGITKIETSVQLLKLFRNDAKILEDYRWMEANLGKLVPMELVVSVRGDRLRTPSVLPPDESSEEAPITPPTDEERLEFELAYSMLQRVELSSRIRETLLDVFGDRGLKHVGPSMSADVAVPLKQVVKTQERNVISRTSLNAELEAKRNLLTAQDYLRDQIRPIRPDDATAPVADELPNELWRISLRMAALNDVDYGQFVSEAKTVVEPILYAYRCRTELIKSMQAQLGVDSLDKGRVLVLGPVPRTDHAPLPSHKKLAADDLIDPTLFFSRTFRDLLVNSGYEPYKKNSNQDKMFTWFDPASQSNRDNPEWWKKVCSSFDTVVLIEESPYVARSLIQANAKSFIDASGHSFEIDPSSRNPLPGMLTARQRYEQGDHSSNVTAVYTGIVPIVYKAQRALLTSLMESILLAFIMIMIVMMILLRPWRERPGPGNLLNVRGGILAMLPNVFPVVMIFGAMGWLSRFDVKVDIGSMMTASVAMGVAVDDTIHFLNWFRHGLSQGKSRLDSIRLAYDKVATAMTQTTLIAGLGLSAFAFSTFMPTQRFGILMLVLLATALVGDLIFLPALLAGPLGRFFGKSSSTNPESGLDASPPSMETAEALSQTGPDADVATVRLPNWDEQPESGEQSRPGEAALENGIFPS